MIRWISLLIFLFSLRAEATVLLLDRNDWQLQMNGFVEADWAHDRVPSFLESVGNYPAAGSDTPLGPKGPKEISVRNSRLAFTLLPPGQETWKPKAYVEFDLLGNRLALPFAGSSDTYYTNPSLRIRHLYLSAENDGWKFLTGQYWTLFGWNPVYVLATASVAPGPGSIYERTQQFTAIKTYSLSEKSNLQLGLSFEHASNKAGGVPNIDAGTRFAYSGIQSGFSAPTGDTKTEPLSLALSGTMRKFGTGSTLATSDSIRKLNAQAFALDTLIPLIPSEDGKEPANTLTLTAEFSAGTGYGDAFPGWSANLPQFPYDGASADTYMSKGQGGFNGDGYFQLFHLQSWNTQLQYHFPGSQHFFMTAGHSQLHASNVQGLGPVPSGLVPYDDVDMNFVNLFHDFCSELRAGIEYAKFTTHYINDLKIEDERFQISAFYRF